MIFKLPRIAKNMLAPGLFLLEVATKAGARQDCFAALKNSVLAGLLNTEDTQ